MKILLSNAFEDVNSLKEAPRNANRFDPARFELLKQAIRDKGFLQPVLTRPLEGNNYEIIDGHHRVRAAKELGLEKVPMVVVDADADEAAVLALGMNRLRGELNLGDVGDILASLSSVIDPSELTYTGFSASEIDALVQATTAEMPDDPLPQSMEGADDGPGADKPFIIEIEFADKKDYQKARRGLKRAAGKGNELAVGLMRLLGEEEEARS